MAQCAMQLHSVPCTVCHAVAPAHAHAHVRFKIKALGQALGQAQWASLVAVEYLTDDHIDNDIRLPFSLGEKRNLSPSRAQPRAGS